MKVLMTVHRFWPSIGGTEAFVEGLSETLAANGHDVTVATSSEPGAPAEETRNGYRIRRFELLRKGKFRFPGKDYRSFVRDGPWDVINVHGQRVWSSDYIYDLCHKIPTPIVWTGHGFYQYHMGKLRPAEWAYYHHVLPYAFKDRHTIAETEGEKEELVRFGFRADRIRVVSSSLDVTEFQAPHRGFRAKYGFTPDEPVLLYIGGFYPNKRVDRVVELAAKTRAKTVVIGRDPDPQERNLAECKALAARLDAPVSFLGKIPWEDVLSAYQESTLFVFPTQFEGYGLVLLEAMASGLPFVASRAGAAPELAAMGCGVSAPDVDAMAQAVRDLLADPKRREQMAATGRERAKEFTWDKVARGYEETYARAIREQGGKRA